jgi:sterol 3beta-glucosyltransferase
MPLRVSLLTIGSRGDVEPFLALATALQRRGAAPTLVTHERFRPLARHHGIGFAPLPGDPAALMATRAGQRALKSRKNFVRFLAEFHRVGRELADAGWDAALEGVRGSDALVYSTFAYQGYYLAQALGIPSLGAHLQPVFPTGEFASPAVPFPLPSKMLRRLSHVAAMALFWRFTRSTMADTLARRAPDLPRPTRSPVAELMRQAAPMLVAVSPTVVPRPHDWPPFIHQTGFWFLAVEQYAPPPALAHFLAGGPAPVYVGFGSLQQPDPLAARRLVDEALLRAGRRGVVHPGWSGLDSSRGTADVFVLDEDVPHRWLFPRMAAVVHHGGAGTTAAGLLAAVPAVVVPHFGDQWFWADRVKGLGAGVVVPRPALTAERLADGIRRATSLKFPTPIAARIAAEDGAARAAAAVLSAATR